MRPERVLIWLPLLGLAACSPGILVLSASTHCWGMPWLCYRWDHMLKLAGSELLIVVPWMVLIAAGLRAGALQLSRTRRAIRRMLCLPQVQLPVSLANLVYDLKLLGRLDVVRCSSADAFCYGLVWPRICVTTGLLESLSTAEIEAVLRHERHHLRRYDPLRALLWTMLDGACWWMAPGGEQARLYRELAADRAVILAGRRWPLASALLKLIGQPQGGAMSARDLAISGLSVTDARIEQLLQPEQMLTWRRPMYHWLVVPALLTLTVFLCAG